MARNYNEHYGYDDAPAEHGRTDVRSQMSAAAQEVKEIQEAQAQGKAVPDYKLLGLISMPATAGAIIKPVLNIAQGYVAEFIQHGSGRAIQNYGAHLGLKNAQQIQIAQQVIGFTTGAATLLATEAGSLWNSFAQYKRKLVKAGAEIAPVLDDIKGGHGFVSMVGVTREQNEVIYVHRKQVGSILSLESNKTLIGASAKAPILYSLIQNSAKAAGFEFKMPAFMKAGGEQDAGQRSGSFGVRDMATTAFSSLGEVYQNSIDIAYREANARPSAFTMITKLAALLKDDPQASEFSVPGTHRAVDLRQYIALTFKGHQEDMAKVDADCTPIRKSLDADLMRVSGRIAEAITQGELNPLMLVRLVGECQIVRNNGRTIAKTKDVERAIAKLSGKVARYVQADPKEFFDGFTKQDMSDALGKLEGAERQIFIASVPQNIAKDAGISDKEYQDAQELAATNHKHAFAQMVAGLGAQGVEKLQAAGLSAEDISQIKEAAEAMAEGGEKVVGKFTQAVAPTLQRVVIEKAKAGDAHFIRDLTASGKEVLSRKVPEHEGFADRERLKREADLGESRALHS